MDEALESRGISEINRIRWGYYGSILTNLLQIFRIDNGRNPDPTKDSIFYQRKLEEFMTLHSQGRFEDCLNAKSIESEFNPEEFIKTKTKNGQATKFKSKALLQSNIDAGVLSDIESPDGNLDLGPKSIIGESVIF